MWPSLNKALYCCAGEVALLSKTKWTSQLAISGNVCVYTAGEGCSHGIILTTQLISLCSLEVGIIWTLHKTSESQNMFLIGFGESKFSHSDLYVEVGLQRLSWAADGNFLI